MRWAAVAVAVAGDDKDDEKESSSNLVSLFQRQAQEYVTRGYYQLR